MLTFELVEHARRSVFIKKKEEHAENQREAVLTNSIAYTKDQKIGFWSFHSSMSFVPHTCRRAAFAMSDVAICRDLPQLFVQLLECVTGLQVRI